MEAALTLPPTNMVAAGLCRCVRPSPSQRSLRCRAAQLSREMPPARRRRYHFLPAFSPTTSATHPPRLTVQSDRTRRASPVRSLLTLRLRHAAPTHAQPQRLTALPHAYLPLLHTCTESEICIPTPHPYTVAPRAMTAHTCSSRQLHLHMLGHAHAATSSHTAVRAAFRHPHVQPTCARSAHERTHPRDCQLELPCNPLRACTMPRGLA